jgi:hypothetical protein
MSSRSFLHFSLISIFALGVFASYPSYTAASHARIIRLSLVQGDVRILHDSKGDPLGNDKATWDRAELNLPIREHDVIATDHGRAEVEFENGAMAFLNENSVLEFFDLSLDDGALATRLILRQGTGSFYANPANNDYFSVTGGDFTAEAGSRANFRMDNFDDGSTVSVQKGHVAVVRQDDRTELAKGESFTMRPGEDTNASIGRAADGDDFDRWVSGREDSVVTATKAAMQYSNNSSYHSGGYTSGFADLYTYGGFYPISGFGYGWQPYGVGIGWSPFDNGNWFFSSGLGGWSFIGNQPWGWLPYHYGGWLFEPGIGWLWAPTGFGGRLPSVKYHPVTATFVHSGSNVAIVPTHPNDSHGKTPLNLAHGVITVTGRPVTTQAASTTSDWKVLKEAPREALTSKTAPAAAPARVTRTLESSNVPRGASAGSSIVYDAKEHRFVNSNVNPASAARETAATTRTETPAASTGRTAAVSVAPATTSRASRTASVPSASARVSTPPPARSYSGGRGFSEGGSSRGGTMQMGSGRAPSAPSAAPRASTSGRPH